jgi:hypothetical protein
MIALATLAPQLQKFFTETAEQVARATHFGQRASKLTGAAFLQVVVFGWLVHPTASLNDLVEVVADMGVSITKQGLQTRVEQAAPFLKAMFQESLAVFRQQLPLPVAVRQQFTAIILTDSTSIGLPVSLQADFPGCGGDGPVAALKIQLAFDLLCGEFVALTLQPGRTPDQAYTGDVQDIRAGALYLSDLGYWALSRLQAIAQQAFFLSRLDTHTTLFNATTGEPLDLLSWLEAHPEAQFEQDIRLGAAAQLPCRLGAFRVPTEVAAQRRRRATETARRKGRTLSQRHLALLAWSLFVTNVPARRLALAHLVVLYTVRWQIELLFKLWKSECAVDRVAGRHRARVLTEVYAKLLGLVLLHYLMAPFRGHARELSMVTAVRIMRHYLPQLLDNLVDLARLQTTLQKIERRLALQAAKGPRRKRLTTLQKLRALEITLA